MMQAVYDEIDGLKVHQSTQFERNVVGPLQKAEDKHIMYQMLKARRRGLVEWSTIAADTFCREVFPRGVRSKEEVENVLQFMGELWSQLGTVEPQATPWDTRDELQEWINGHVEPLRHRLREQLLIRTYESQLSVWFPRWCRDVWKGLWNPKESLAILFGLLAAVVGAVTGAAATLIVQWLTR
jgi:hypothetical protein